MVIICRLELREGYGMRKTAGAAAAALLLATALGPFAVPAHAGMGVGGAPAGRSGLANPPGDSVIQKKKGPAVKDGAAKGDGSVKGAAGKAKP
jgi:hypothetical protein